MGLFDWLSKKNKESVDYQDKKSEDYNDEKTVDYHDGDFAKCVGCGNMTKIKFFGNGNKDKNTIFLMGPDVYNFMKKENTALRCQICEHVICFSCASSSVQKIPGFVTLACTECGGKPLPFLR